MLNDGVFLQKLILNFTKYKASQDSYLVGQ